MSPRADNATDPGLETRSTGPLYDRALGLPTRLWGPADVPSQALRIGACIDTAVARSAASFASIDAPPIRESTLGREATTGVGLSTGPGSPAASPPGKKTVRASRRGPGQHLGASRGRASQGQTPGDTNTWPTGS